MRPAALLSSAAFASSQRVPPMFEEARPASAICTRFLHASTNKAKNPVNAVAVRACACRLSGLDSSSPPFFPPPAQWLPGGRRLISGASNGEYTLWDGASFKFVTTNHVRNARESEGDARQPAHLTPCSRPDTVLHVRRPRVPHHARRLAVAGRAQRRLAAHAHAGAGVRARHPGA